VDEKLLLVTAGADPRTHERLIALAKHIGRHFDQDSVCSSHTDENTYFLGTTNRGFVDPPFGKTKVLVKLRFDYIAITREMVGR
jgi:hypothetical protein